MAQARASTEPGDAVAGLLFLGASFLLGAASLRWLLRGGRVGGGLVLVGWIGWWSGAIATAQEIHTSREHDHSCCC